MGRREVFVPTTSSFYPRHELRVAGVVGRSGAQVIKQPPADMSDARVVVSRRAAAGGDGSIGPRNPPIVGVLDGDGDPAGRLLTTLPTCKSTCVASVSVIVTSTASALPLLVIVIV